MAKQKKCKICKETFTLTRPLQVVCSYLCALKYAKKKGEYIVKKENRKKKQDFYANDIKTRKAAAKRECHKYIRLRDKDQPCICCGKPLGPKYDAGHFLESGNNSRIRYDEDNIHAQRVYCNHHKHGNPAEYEKNLIIKIGQDRVDRLKSLQGGTVKRTAQDYKAIEDYYKKKYKELLAARS